ncbi:MAG: glucuronate isomerase [Ignavibacteria bacterium]|nr:glucuronate isomerase [Ignavibacteria bacterium]
MPEFIHEHFLLHNRFAEELYHTFAKQWPIIDYHCHLIPREIAENRSYENMTRIWLEGDHYKWRAMRTNGVAEKYCTGAASDWEKFLAWAKTVPATLRNPLYHWTHMELKIQFGIGNLLLNENTAKRVWDECNAKLATPEFSAQGIIRQMNVEMIATTDDPVDTLEYHARIRTNSALKTTVVPTFRPDKAVHLDDIVTFGEWLKKLESTSGVSVKTFDDYLQALKKCHDFFHRHGCRISDLSGETFYAEKYTLGEIKKIFAKARSGKKLTPPELNKFRSVMFYELSVMNHARGWVQQFHVGALRDVNGRMFESLGPNTGYDIIGDYPIAKALAQLLGRLDSEHKLAKTILYNLNPADNDVLAAVIGTYQDGSVPGKIQFGSAWWFLDQKQGMEAQMNSLSNMGLLSRFVGMLTDSRSILSYPRHEYFRRILCNLLGDEIKKGLIPHDIPLVGAMVEDICYRNARNYFDYGQQ